VGPRGRAPLTETEAEAELWCGGMWFGVDMPVFVTVRESLLALLFDVRRLDI
jgi:hypothetical protein